MSDQAAELPIVPGIRPGLRVVVTAGCGGIGRAIADSFIANGARVAVSDVDDAALNDFRSAHPAHLAMAADAGVERDADTFMDGALTHLGGLDVLVNNAGISGPTGKIERLAGGDWRRTLDVNLSSIFFHTRRAVPSLRDAAAGHGEAWIVNLASVAGRVGFAQRSPYAASKWGVIGLTQSLSLELGEHGIRVNAILPGPVAGDQIERVFAARARELGITAEEVKTRRLESVALKHLVTAQDVANMTLVLCSPLGRNVAGQPVSVCGHAFAM